MSRYILIPVDDGEAKTLDIPPGLIVNSLYDNLSSKVADKKRLKWLTIQLAKNRISEGQDGGITCKDRCLFNFKLRTVVKDICNHRYLEEYEPFYKFLRSVNVTL